MRIISDYKDYYDNAQCYMLCDNDKVFVRKTSMEEKTIDFSFRELSLPNNHYITQVSNNILYNSYTKKNTHLDWVVVGFCGILYPAIKASYSDKNGYNFKSKFFYTFENILESLFCEKDIAKNNIDIPYGLVGWSRKRNKTKEKLTATLNSIKENLEKTKVLKDLFLKYKSPLFLLKFDDRDKTTTVNFSPNLSKLEFYKVFDSVSTYQEIDMFLNNELVMEKQVPSITDDIILRNSKGFDKYSFKKLPTKKR